MKQVAFVTEDINTKKKMDETSGIPDGTDPKEYLEDLLKDFNKEEDKRKAENPEYTTQYRKLIEVKEETGKQAYCLGFCKFGGKLNLITIQFKDYSFDVYRCNDCKLLIQRTTFQMPQASCYPELSCVKCNKYFKSISTYNRHMKKGSHKMPLWIDFARNLADLGDIY